MAQNPADRLNTPSSGLLSALKQALTDLHDRLSKEEAAVGVLQTGYRESVDSLVARFTNEFTDLLTASATSAAALQSGDFVSATVVETASLTAGPITLTLQSGGPLPFLPSPVVMISRTGSTADYAIARKTGYDPATRRLTATIVAVIGDAGPFDDLFVEIGAISAIAGTALLDALEASQAAAEQAAQEAAEDAVATAADRVAVVAARGLVEAKFFGDSAGHPTVDGDGDPLTAGVFGYNSTLNRVEVFNGTAWEIAGSITEGKVIDRSFTATAAQTVFDMGLSLYAPGFAFVYRNGVLLDRDEADITSGTEVALTSGAAAGDLVRVVAFPNLVVTTISDAAESAALTQAKISGLASAPADLSDETLVATAEIDGDNEKRTAVEVFDLGEELVRRTVAHAEASTIRKTISTVRTNGFASRNDGGGAHYKRVNAEPAHSGKFRSQDHWTADGNSDSANGGWWEIAELSPNQYQFGAKGDGVADDTVAVQNLLTFVNIANVSARMPAGTHLLTSKVAVNVSGSDARIRMGLHGAGFYATKFICSGEGGIEITTSNRDVKFRASDFSLVARGAARGDALRVENPEGGNQHERAVIIERVEVFGENAYDDYFTRGIVVRGVLRPTVSYCTVRGRIGSLADSANFAPNSPIYDMTSCYDFFGSYGPEVIFSTGKFAALGLKIGSGVSPGAEGHRIEHSAFVQVRDGIDIYTLGNEPGGIINNCHINFGRYGIVADGCKVEEVTNISFYNVDATDAETSTTVYDIWVKRGSYWKIQDNEFSYPGSTKRVHIKWDGAAVANDRSSDLARPVFREAVTVSGNSFESPTAAATANFTTQVPIVWGDNYACLGRRSIKQAGEELPQSGMGSLGNGRKAIRISGRVTDLGAIQATKGVAVIEDTLEAYLTFLISTGGKSGLLFSNGANHVRREMEYDPATGNIDFKSNGTMVARIFDSGTVETVNIFRVNGQNGVVSSSFTTADGKTVTVKGGIIVSIV
ncbi:hypothetical protein [Aurantimonas sp. VKM B-3413]|uniref:hypothetical protein n=1 Tax=Aurantimonas sp. VKM B-3413 TaxID=2779401 RepID=UPI001E6524C8|nr:hypothetical protein [Aurantimonas sp. VKM B-3413]MCB8835934.1 hypothetical protein [Aurantimonas sp. VKM B-3413]